MASPTSSDLFESWPERAQRMQSQVSGPSSCRISKTVYPDDTGKQGLAASRLSGYAYGVSRDVDSPVVRSVTPCTGRCDPKDLSVRWENTRSQLPSGQASTQFATVDKTFPISVVSPIWQISVNNRVKFWFQGIQKFKLYF